MVKEYYKNNIDNEDDDEDEKEKVEIHINQNKNKDKDINRKKNYSNYSGIKKISIKRNK